MMRFLEHYISNFDDDKTLAEDLLKVFYGRRDHNVEAMSDEELLQLAAIHATLAQAHATRGVEDKLDEYRQ